MEEFEARLAAAYTDWHASRGRTPERFFELYGDDIELHSILEASLMSEMRGPLSANTPPSPISPPLPKPGK